MKKFMFSAFACVAFAFSGFASNEVVSDLHIKIESVKSKLSICKYTVYVTDSEGISCEFSSSANNGKPIATTDCGLYASNYTKGLEEQGFKIDKVVITTE